MQIYQLKLRLSNAYLIRGTKPILVDTGTIGELETIRRKLRVLEVEFSDLALLLHTHVHSDHFGNTAKIAAEAKCPVAFHGNDQAIVDRATNGRLLGVGLRGRVMAKVFSEASFNRVKADLFVSNGMSLSDYGCDATIVETPGHTPGSISIITPEGDAIIGDVIMGGWMGGLLMPGKPNYHYFAEDLPLAMKSLDAILAKTTRTLYVGHGGPLAHARVQAWRHSIVN